MTSNLFTQTPAALNMGYCVVEALRKKITFANNATTVVVGVVPPKALVIGGGIFVTTAFNGTTPTANVGAVDSTTVAAAFASAISVAALGFIALDELAAVTNTRVNVERSITVSVTAAGGTTGEAEVIILVVNDHTGA